MKTYKNSVAYLLLCLLAMPPALFAQVQSTPGLKLVATGELRLVFQDISLINNGQLSPGHSTAVFKGSSIGGNHPINFHHLIIGEETILNNDILVEGRLRLEKGNLQLNSHSVDLGYTGHIVGERNESRITGNSGFVKSKALLNAPLAVNPGNIGVEISSKAAMGETEIIRGHTLQFNAEGKPIVQRYYDIRPQFNFNLRASLKFYYLDAELNNGQEDALLLYTAKDTRWTEAGKDRSDLNTNWIVKNDLDQLHRFTLAGATNKLISAQNSKTFVQLFPNPTPGQFTVMLNSTEAKEAALILYDQLGRQLERKKIVCVAGMNNISYNIDRYANGTYYLSFENLDLKTVKIVKH